MSAISVITQTHLSILMLDTRTKTALSNIPIFAEVILTAQTQPKLLRAEESFHLEPQIASMANLSISRYADYDAYLNLSNTDKSKLISRIEKLLTGSQDPFKKIDTTLDDWSAQAQLLVDSAVQKCLEELGLTARVVELKTKSRSVPLGFLATDRVGYASFDLRQFNESQTAMETDANVSTSYSVKVYPYGLEELGINALSQGRVTSGFIFAKLELPHHPEDAEFKTAGMHSMQNPDLIDWYLSPGSFSVNAEYFIGQDGCENLFPANFATKEFRFFQILRGGILAEERNVTVPGALDPFATRVSPKIHSGWLLDYSASWQPLGHTTGEIVYSLPLAPGEIVKIAIVDWARRSRDSRDDDLTVKEQLQHNTHRERTISETVNAALSEWQRGGSFMGGKADSAGISAVAGAVGISGGTAQSLGGGYSTSSGNRNIAASTVQQASDAFAQRSSAFRELRSTVVIQSDQAEDAKAETRVIANHNHSHALTMLYYEVLRHFKVTTQFVRYRNTLLVDFSKTNKVDLTIDDHIVRFKDVILAVLIDQSLIGPLQLLSKYIYLKKQIAARVTIKEERSYSFKSFQIRLKTGDNGFDGDVRVAIQKKDATYVELEFPGSAKDKYILDKKGYSDFEDGDDEIYVLASTNEILWGDILSLRISASGPTSWKLAYTSFTAFSSDGAFELLGQARNDLLSNSQVLIPITNLPKPTVSVPSVSDKFSEAENVGFTDLKSHLLAHHHYYMKAIWLSEDPDERAARFEAIEIGGKSLLDLVENRPLDVLGNYVVFASNDQAAGQPPFPIENIKIEKLMTLPTRGVFAEAKLGHCNASELIDNTRFWDWQKSPITETPPDINPVSTDSRNVTQNLTPSQLPPSIVNIVNPSNLPDPNGLTSALSLLGKSDVFRDMSMGKEVNELLKKLSDNSISIAEAANKAREIQNKRAEGSTGSTSEGNDSADASGSGKPSGVPSGKVKEPDLTPEKFMDWMNAAKNSSLSPKDKKDVMEDVKQAAKRSVNPPAGTKLSAPASKEKIFLFQALDFKGNRLDSFPIQATVFDILHSKTVLEKVSFTGSQSTALKFEDATPTLTIILQTTPSTITFDGFTFTVPRISKQNEAPLTLQAAKKLYVVTLKQKSITAKIIEKTNAAAAKTLSDEYGAKLGFSKEVAAELIAKSGTQTVSSKNNENAIEYSVVLPDNAYDLIIVAGN